MLFEPPCQHSQLLCKQSKMVLLSYHTFYRIAEKYDWKKIQNLLGYHAVNELFDNELFDNAQMQSGHSMQSMSFLTMYPEI